jgi:hypothetical protein
MKKHEKARILMIVCSTYLYSTTMIPNRLNTMLLRWTEKRKLPTKAQIRWLKKQIDPTAYPELFGGNND